MKTVLVVEDNALVAELIGSCLQSLRADLRCVNSAEEALDSLRSGFKPDLILTDIVLPKRSGTDLVKHLRSHSTTRDLPIIAVTVLGDETTANQLKSTGFDGVIPKPIDPARFAAQVAQWLK
jgi:CheY-like chemotaxis protein